MREEETPHATRHNTFHTLLLIKPNCSALLPQLRSCLRIRFCRRGFDHCAVQAHDTFEI